MAQNMAQRQQCRHIVRHTSWHTLRCAAVRVATVPAQCQNSGMLTLPVDTLQSMMAAGLSDELLGRAVRELLHKGTATATSTSGAASQQSAAAAPPEALASRVAHTGPNATAPATAWTGRAGPAAQQRRSEPVAGAPSSPPRNDLVPLKVRFPDGSATNIVVPREMLDKLAAVEGSVELARQRLRLLAQSAPADTSNRSRWVQARARELAG